MVVCAFVDPRIFSLFECDTLAHLSDAAIGMYVFDIIMAWKLDAC